MRTADLMPDGYGVIRSDDPEVSTLDVAEHFMWLGVETCAIARGEGTLYAAPTWAIRIRAEIPAGSLYIMTIRAFVLTDEAFREAALTVFDLGGGPALLDYIKAIGPEEMRLWGWGDLDRAAAVLERDGARRVEVFGGDHTEGVEGQAAPKSGA